MWNNANNESMSQYERQAKTIMPKDNTNQKTKIPNLPVYKAETSPKHNLSAQRLDLQSLTATHSPNSAPTTLRHIILFITLCA
ncbi:hypothetical protein SK128_009373 [Halocaridina rubra]|uniref:Uncharacterized protein n=1 Tax=Halocaridina rubra TaxID=373956 RepID=A0AAN8XQQ4_HALRR